MSQIGDDDSAETGALLNNSPPQVRSRWRVANILLTLFVVAIVIETVVSAVVFHVGFNSLVANVFFASALALIVISQGLMLFWYRQGELDPKFRYYLYFAAFCTLLMCVAGNLFYHLPLNCKNACPACPPTNSSSTS